MMPTTTMQQMEIEQAEAHNHGLWKAVRDGSVQDVRALVENDPAGACCALWKRGPVGLSPPHIPRGGDGADNCSAASVVFNQTRAISPLHDMHSTSHYG